MALLTQSDIDAMSDDEKMDLLDKAKDAYYNGEPILSDILFDKLEKAMGLENKNYVGAKTGKYTIKHTFLMGSLAKVQINEDKKGNVNWQEAARDLSAYINKSDGSSVYETTPKLDGCSFSAEFKNVGGKAELVACATRGNGEYGSDVTRHFKAVLKTQYFDKIDECVASLCDEDSDDILCIRGEMLIPYKVFNTYNGDFVNPRSAVASITGKDWNSDPSFIQQVNDLHWVCYDYRLVKNGVYTELSWMDDKDSTYHMLQPYLNHIGELPDAKWCQVHTYNGKISVDELQAIYYDYDDYRNTKCPYALDGVVFKPMSSTRQYNEDRRRPVDCVAMKFMPQLAQTTIIDIDWTTGKTNEYSPTAIIKTVVLDGKQVNRANLGSYSSILKKGTAIGATIMVGLSGDIIPDVKQIVTPVDANDDNMNIPSDAYVEEHENSGTPHLYKDLSGDDLVAHQFCASAQALDIPSIGPAARKEIWNALHDDIEDLDNIVKLMNDDAYELILKRLGNSRSIQVYVDNLKQFKANMTLKQLIMSFCFPSCGNVASDICARIISGLPYTPSGASVGYNWALNQSSREYYMVTSAMDELGIEPLTEDNSDVEQIPVILTGEPTDGTTKAKWLARHPQFIMTTKWAECKVLFTNDLQSTTGKMQKANDINRKGKQHIYIKSYDDADTDDADLALLGYTNVNESKHISREAKAITKMMMDELDNNNALF